MPGSTCPACGAAAFVSGTCTRCGYADGESNRCPHCNAIARVEGEGKSAVCAVCGGPRILANHGGEAAAAALKQQRKLLSTARLASVATVVQALFAVVATLIGLAILPATIVGKLLVFAIAVVPLVLAIRSRSRATTARTNAKDAGERAWQAAAEDIAGKMKNGITASALAKTLAIEPAEADRLLTSLAVHDRTRVDVGDDAEVVYSVHPEAQVRVSEDDSEREAEGDDSEREAPAKEKERTP